MSIPIPPPTAPPTTIVIGGSLEDYGYMEYVYDAGGSFVGSAGILPTGYDSANSPPWLTAYEEARGLSF